MIHLRLQRIETAMADGSKPADYLDRLKAVASEVNDTHLVLSDKSYEAFARANQTHAALAYAWTRRAGSGNRDSRSGTKRPLNPGTRDPQPESIGLRGRSVFEQTGSDNWAVLHRSRPDRSWLAKFRNMIPCGPCKAHWDQTIRRFPPDDSSVSAWFAWGVKVHNEVNRRLGKPIVSLEQAKCIWRPVPIIKRTPETNRIIGGIENRYLNKACFIVAGGPSLAGMDLSALRQPGILMFGVNNSPAILRPHLWTCGEQPRRGAGRAGAR